jgi:hypothetical protein
MKNPTIAFNNYISVFFLDYILISVYVYTVKDHLAIEFLRFGDSVGNVLHCSNYAQNAEVPDDRR